MMPSDPSVHLDAGRFDACDLAGVAARLDAFAAAATIPATPCPTPAMPDFESSEECVASTLRMLPGGGRLLHLAIRATGIDHPHGILEWRMEGHPTFRDATLRTPFRTDGRGIPVGHGDDPSLWDDATVLAGYAALIRSHAAWPRRGGASPCPEIDAAMATVTASMSREATGPDDHRSIVVHHPSPFRNGSIDVDDPVSYGTMPAHMLADAWTASLPQAVRLIVNDVVSNQNGSVRPTSLTFTDARARNVDIPGRPDPLALLRAHAMLPHQPSLRIVPPWETQEDGDASEEDVG